MKDTAPINDVKWFFGGNATFTVSNPSGKYFTFKVKKVEANERFQNEAFFISVMTGPDNESDYTYMGILHRDGKIKLTKKSKVNAVDIRLKVAEWAIRKVMLGDIPDGYSVMHAGRCCVCGRKLTVPASISKGIGAKCEKGQQ